MNSYTTQTADNFPFSPRRLAFRLSAITNGILSIAIGAMAIVAVAVKIGESLPQ